MGNSQHSVQSPDMWQDRVLRLFSHLTYIICTFVSHYFPLQGREAPIAAPVINFLLRHITHSTHGASNLSTLCRGEMGRYGDKVLHHHSACPDFVLYAAYTVLRGCLALRLSLMIDAVTSILSQSSVTLHARLSYRNVCRGTFINHVLEPYPWEVD